MKVGGADYVEDKQTGARWPNLHKARRGLIIVTVKGEMVGRDPAVLVPPAPHYTEDGKTIVRAWARENTMLTPAILDREKGIYVMRYEEVYLSAGPVQPPTHSGEHQLLEAVERGAAPASGGGSGWSQFLQEGIGQLTLGVGAR